MPRFSDASFKILSSCHIDLQTLFYQIIKYVDCKALCGYRDEKDQNLAYKQGTSRIKWPNGKHNKYPSHALDCVPWPVPMWKNTSDFIYFGGYVMGVARMLKEAGKISHDIRYGGDFNMNQRITDENFLDAVHYEIITL